MRRTLVERGLKDDRGATAATVALSLFGLVAVGGLAFDYARIAALDTELQQAADQAALAAASQLDGQAGTCSRAALAASTLVANNTRFGNDGGGLPITIALEPRCDNVGNVRFFQDKAKTIAATNDANANFVEVTVNPRHANFALTPIVSILTSVPLRATAYAGLGSTICRVPPLLICNPDESDANTDPLLVFDVASRIGRGLKLIAQGNYAPGNVGFLSITGSDGANELAKALGWENLPIDCVATDSGDAVRVEAEPGQINSVRSAFNTRFDMSDGPGLGCVAGGSCPPSRNVRKDLIKSGAASDCSDAGWSVPSGRYYPPTDAPLPTTITPEVMGYPRDICHARDSFTSCGSGRFGDSVWDRDAYFRSNYGWDHATWQSMTGFSDNVTRYDVYRWEILKATTTNPEYLGPKAVTGGTAHSSPICWTGRPAGGVVPSQTSLDRRRLSVAIVNCTATGLRGRMTVPVTGWMDIFLIEPAFDRPGVTSSRDIYVEVIGETNLDGGGTSGGTLRRDVPYLIE